MNIGEKTSASQFNINLSILRIVACFMVVSIHTGINAGWTQYVEAGQYGVQLFFVLSGFLIFQSLSSGISVGAFYKKRVMRIVPEYWTALVLYWFVGVIESVFVSGGGSSKRSELIMHPMESGIYVTLRLPIFFSRQMTGICGTTEMHGGQ